jgi:hypothetical protein
MTEDDVFKRTNGAYLCLIRPTMIDGSYRQELAAVVSLAPEVPDAIVASLISEGGWREHVLGFLLAMAKKPSSFVPHVQNSLRVPRGIALTPACAFLAVLARSGEFKMEHSFADELDRGLFDGEMGWAIDKAMFHAGLRPDDVGGRGPYYGQIFEDYVELYCWARTAWLNS